MRRRSRILCFVAAAIAYLAVALWNFRAVLPAPATLLPENPNLNAAYATLGRLDLTMVLWVVTGNADRLLHRPWAVRSEGQCHPLPRAYTLGEHMLGESVLATVPLAATGDPILTYNAVLVATLWIAALAMYALALHFTGSAPAAFVAGLLFCLEPGRIKDSGHPFIHGDLWAPLVLLFLHRTLARGGLGNALACALFFSLTVLESLYVLLGVVLAVAVYGLWAAFVHRARIGRWLAPLAIAAALVGLVAYLVLAPYLATRATWDVLVRPGTIFMPLGAYAPGQFAFPGWALVGLVVVALVDRARRRRDEEGEDPRLALLVAAVLVLLSSVRTVPLLGFELPSPFLVLKQVVPGLDAVRALASVGRVAILPASLLAAYGVVALVERRGPRSAVAVAAALAAVVLAERFVPAAAHATFGSTLDLGAYVARPPDEDVALLREHARGALLDLPHALGATQQMGSGNYMMLASFSPRPVAACYNSFPSPLSEQVGALASALPRAAAVDALVALGFETLLLHADRMEPRRVKFFTELVGVDPAIAARIELLGRSDRLLVFRLKSPAAVGDDPALLAATEPDGEAHTMAPGRGTLAVTITNRAATTYAQRAPIAPTALEARWHDPSGAEVRRERVRVLLPIALAAGARGRTTVTLDAPDRPGSYVLTLALEGAPGTVVARTPVTVATPPPAHP